MTAHLEDQYALRIPLGSSAVGTVWRAEEKTTGSPAAVAVLDSTNPAATEMRPRFVDDSRALLDLDHPNVVRVLDVGVNDEDEPFMAMEMLEGQTLSERLQEQPPLTIQELVRVIMGALDGLRATHRIGVVHGDLDPGNIYLLKGARTKLIGFGVNRAAARSGKDNWDTTSVLIPSFGYMSPEQARGEELSPRDDLYAIGVILYEAICGILPRQGEDIGGLREEIASNIAPPSLASRRPEIDGALSRVVDRAIAVDPNERFGDASRMRLALMSALIAAPDIGKLSLPMADRGTSVVPTPPPEPLVAPAVGVPVEGEQTKPRARALQPNSSFKKIELDRPPKPVSSKETARKIRERPAPPPRADATKKITRRSRSVAPPKPVPPPTPTDQEEIDRLSLSDIVTEEVSAPPPPSTSMLLGKPSRQDATPTPVHRSSRPKVRGGTSSNPPPRRPTPSHSRTVKTPPRPTPTSSPVVRPAEPESTWQTYVPYILCALIAFFVGWFVRETADDRVPTNTVASAPATSATAMGSGPSVTSVTGGAVETAMGGTAATATSGTGTSGTEMGGTVGASPAPTEMGAGSPASAETDVPTGAEVPGIDEPEPLRVALLGLPRGADVLLDGESARTPLSIPDDGERHTLVVTADGYQRWQRTQRFRRSTDLRVDMQREVSTQALASSRPSEIPTMTTRPTPMTTRRTPTTTRTTMTTRRTTMRRRTTTLMTSEMTPQLARDPGF